MHRHRSKMAAMGLFGVLALLASGCEPTPEEEARVIKVSGPISLTGTYAGTCSKIVAGIQATIKWVNETHGGVDIGATTKATLELAYQDDASDDDRVEALTQAACDDAAADFILAPYSSGLTETAAVVAEKCKKTLLVHGGASNSIYEAGRRYLAGSIAPASRYHRGILDAVAQAEAGAVAGIEVGFLYEDSTFARSIEAAAVEYAASLGFATDVVAHYPNGSTTSAELADAVAAAVADPPDLVLGGGHATDGRLLTRALAEAGVSPTAFSLLVAPTDQDFYDLVEPCPAPCN